MDKILSEKYLKNKEYIYNWNNRHPEKFKHCQRVNVDKWRNDNREKYNEYQKTYMKKWGKNKYHWNKISKIFLGILAN